MKVIYCLKLWLMIATVFLCFNVANARDKKNLTWLSEPDSFMGLKFGEPLSNHMPECPKHKENINGNIYDVYDIDLSFDTKTCWKNLDMEFKTIENPPRLGVAYQAAARVVNDSFEGMIMTFEHFDYLKVLDLFSERYGKPNSEQKTPVQTRAGMKLLGNKYSWIGKNVTIELSEYGRSVDKGELFIFTNSLENSYLEENKKNSALHKDKL